jgi:tetratricopeptide (TPR) repeat protein
MSRFDLADQYYNRALAANPESPETLNNIGYSHYQRSQNGYGIEYLESARAYLERARSIAGDNSVVAENMVRVSTALAQAGKQETEMAAAIPGFQFVSRDLYASWIERLSQSEVLVVTRPDPETAKLSRSLGLAPAVAALTARDARPSCTVPQCLAEMPVLAAFLRDERPLLAAAVDVKDGRRFLIAGLD